MRREPLQNTALLPSLLMAIFLLCQPATAAADAPKLPGVDLKDLDEDETTILLSVLESQFDPCGKNRSFLQSVQDEKTCALAPKLANFCVDKIARGLSKRQIVKALTKELKRLTSRQKFTTEGRPIFGDKAGTVEVVEFYDYQCPHCRMVAEKVKKLLAKKKGVKLVHKQYPLKFHKGARPAAVAALAAMDQGKFETLHDAFFADQDKLDDAHIAGLLAKHGVDMAKFEKARAGAERILKEDMEEGDNAGLEGTPTFYVNGLMVEFEGLEQAIDEALAGK